MIEWRRQNVAAAQPAELMRGGSKKTHTTNDNEVFVAQCIGQQTRIFDLLLPTNSTLLGVLRVYRF